jgi:hypothetical protein
LGAVCAALGYDFPGTTFALAALGRDAQFKLNVAKIHTSFGVANDLTVRNSSANTNDHVGWLAG